MHCALRRRPCSAPRATSSSSARRRRAPRAVALSFAGATAAFADHAGAVSSIDLRERPTDPEPAPPCVVALPGTRVAAVVGRDREPFVVDARRTIARLHLDPPVLACVDAAAVLIVRGIPPATLDLVVPLACPRVTAVRAAVAFRAVLCADRRGLIHVISLKDGARIRAIDIGPAKPKKLIVTPAWGFVVAAVRVLGRAGAACAIVVVTINGETVARAEVSAEVVEWTAWTSTAGFDYVAFCDRVGNVCAFEAGAPDRIVPVKKVSGPVMGMHWLKAEQAIVVAFASGVIEIVPWEVPPVADPRELRPLNDSGP
jgi:hypothetical protein